MYVLRAFQAKRHEITFCNCRAGNMQRQYLRKKWKAIESGEDFHHPDLVKRIMKFLDEEENAPTPTVHWDDDTPPPQQPQPQLRLQLQQPVAVTGA